MVAVNYCSITFVRHYKLGIFHAPFTEDGRKDWNKVLEILANKNPKELKSTK